MCHFAIGWWGELLISWAPQNPPPPNDGGTKTSVRCLLREHRVMQEIKYSLCTLGTVFLTGRKKLIPARYTPSLYVTVYKSEECCACCFLALGGKREVAESVIIVRLYLQGCQYKLCAIWIIKVSCGLSLLFLFFTVFFRRVGVGVLLSILHKAHSMNLGLSLLTVASKSIKS